MIYCCSSCLVRIVTYKKLICVGHVAMGGRGQGSTRSFVERHFKYKEGKSINFYKNVVRCETSRTGHR